MSRCQQFFLETESRVSHSVRGQDWKPWPLSLGSSSSLDVPAAFLQTPETLVASKSHHCLTLSCIWCPQPCSNRLRWLPGSPCADVAANQPLDFRLAPSC